MCDDCPDIDLDSLRRDQLRDAGHGNMPGDVADVLDEWLATQHGVFSSHHGVGVFLDLLAAGGYRVTKIEQAPFPLLPEPTE